MNEIIIRPNEPIDVLQWSGESIIAKQKAEALIVGTPEHERDAVDLVKRIKLFAKEADEVRTAKKAPFFEMGKRIDAAFKPVIDTLNEAEKIIKGKLNIYLNELEKKRVAEEALRMKKFEEDRLKALEASAFEGTNVDVVVPEVTIAKTQSRGDYGMASQQSVWRWEVSDVKKIPVEFLIPDEKKINALVRSGSRTIPGLRIWEDKTISIR